MSNTPNTPKDVLWRLVDSCLPAGQAEEMVQDALTVIHQLIEREVIGEDDSHSDFCTDTQSMTGYCQCTSGYRNQFRLELRHCLSNLMKGKSDA